MKKTYFLVALSLLLGGCMQKGETVFYMPTLKIDANSSKNTQSIQLSSVSYLASDKIWYKKDGLFLHYSRSFLAKNYKEYLADVLEGCCADGKLSVRIIDAYQLYENDKSSYMLIAKVEYETNSGKKTYKVFEIKKDGFGVGPSQAVKGLEAASYGLREKIITEFGGKK